MELVCGSGGVAASFQGQGFEASGLGGRGLERCGV